MRLTGHRDTYGTAGLVADTGVGIAWRWPHVDPIAEWACKGTGQILVDTEFLDLFERLRAQFGGPLPITSGYRSPAHNAAVSTTGTTGPHTTGRAVDVAIRGAAAYRLLGIALGLGYTGIGVSQTGPTRFMHLDTLDDGPGSPRPTIWSY